MSFTFIISCMENGDPSKWDQLGMLENIKYFDCNASILMIFWKSTGCGEMIILRPPKWEGEFVQTMNNK